MSGVSLAESFSSTAWGEVLFQTEFGRVWQFRLCLLVAALGLTLWHLGRKPQRPWRLSALLVWAITVVLLVSLAWISHAAAAARIQPLGLIGDALHLCMAGVWIGGLTPLAVFLQRARGSVSLGETALRVLQRFSTVGLCCVGVLVFGGVSDSWLLVGSLHALVTTRYGWLLIFKLALFAVLIGIGARNRIAIRTRLGKAVADPELLRGFRNRVICEAGLGVMIVAIVGVPGVTAPARHF
jgi:copper resistance protein D